MNKHWILKNHEVVKEVNMMTWAAWFENSNNRRVAFDRVKDIEISTVFLGIDHRYGDGPPLLFETMTFGPDGHEQKQERCSTWDQAIKQHQKILEAIKGK